MQVERKKVESTWTPDRWLTFIGGLGWGVFVTLLLVTLLLDMKGIL